MIDAMSLEVTTDVPEYSEGVSRLINFRWAGDDKIIVTIGGIAHELSHAYLRSVTPRVNFIHSLARFEIAGQLLETNGAKTFAFLMEVAEAGIEKKARAAAIDEAVSRACDGLDVELQALFAGNPDAV